MITREQALPGRSDKMPIIQKHQVFGRNMDGPWPTHAKKAFFALGCFWGAERKFWEQQGVYCTAVGYMGGFTPNPTYEEVCSGMTGHTETVMVVYNQEMTDFWELLEVFWRNIDPTALNYQFADVGSQYRTEIFTVGEEQKSLAEKSKVELDESGKFNKPIVTAISVAPEFYIAEDYHQDFYKKQSMRYKMYAQASGRKWFLEKTWQED